jgi:predicted aspartyl protease
MLSILVYLILLPVEVPASEIPERASFPAKSDTVGIVRFDLYQGYFIVAHGSLGPLKNLNFFLDTGTTLSVLNSRIAKRLNLHGEEAASILVVGGRTPGEEANLPSLEIGPLKRSNLRVITADLSFFEKTLPVRIDAIVGLDVLGKKPFVIDYRARVVRFGLAPALPLSVSVPLRLDRGLAVFDAEIDHTPVHLLLDTGAYSLTLFDRATPRSSGEKSDAVPAGKETGDSESKQIWVHTLRLGPEEFRQKSALVARNPKPSQLDFDGLMSPAALGISRVSVDLNGGVLAFSR